MFSVIIPLFNEEYNIIPLINEINTHLEDFNEFEIILVNDASDDSTLKIVKKIKNNKIKIIDNLLNEGQSFSIHKGVKNSNYNIIVTLDGDGQNDPSDIKKLLKLYKSKPDIKLIGGLRKKRQDSFIKIISSKIANYFRSTILNDDCPDTGCSLKVFSKEIFLSFPYFDGMHRFLPALFKGYGHKTLFIDVNHRKRKFGYSKYGTMNRLFKGIIDMIKVKKIIKKNKSSR
tara:strand:- start:687 stop:1376 length:690 start_codon:yes stop_codon:yes gene_type:complete